MIDCCFLVFLRMGKFCFHALHLSSPAKHQIKHPRFSPCFIASLAIKTGKSMFLEEFFSAQPLRQKQSMFAKNPFYDSFNLKCCVSGRWEKALWVAHATFTLAEQKCQLQNIFAHAISKKNNVFNFTLLLGNSSVIQRIA